MLLKIRFTGHMKSPHISTYLAIYPAASEMMLGNEY